MQDLKKLKVLGLSHNELDESELQFLKGNEQLEVLTFVGNKITDKVFGIVKSLFKNLKEAYLTKPENQIDEVLSFKAQK